MHTPGLWRCVTRPVQSTLVVNDVRVTYAGEEHAHNLIDVIKSKGYKLEVDWTGSQYCKIILDLDYGEQTLTMSMPGFKDDVSAPNCFSSYQPATIIFRKNRQCDTRGYIPNDRLKRETVV